MVIIIYVVVQVQNGFNMIHGVGNHMESHLVINCLNLKTKQLKFCVNDKDQGIAYNDIKISNDIHYRLVVSICPYKAPHSVEIIDFQLI